VGSGGVADRDGPGDRRNDADVVSARGPAMDRFDEEEPAVRRPVACLPVRVDD
jgi:hypothetical protein